jgi:hypothetical protein
MISGPQGHPRSGSGREAEEEIMNRSESRRRILSLDLG